MSVLGDLPPGSGGGGGGGVWVRASLSLPACCLHSHTTHTLQSAAPGTYTHIHTHSQAPLLSDPLSSSYNPTHTAVTGNPCLLLLPKTTMAAIQHPSHNSRLVCSKNLQAHVTIG